MAESRTILLVEDEALIAMNEAVMLRKEGYGVELAYSAEEAIAKIKAAPQQIDLILMDIDLGKGMDGAQAAQEILKEHDIPIIFLSSHTEPEIVAKTEKINSYGYVVKNTGITVLDASIKMAFKLHTAHQTLLRTNEKLVLAQEASYAGTWDWDLIHRKSDWSPALRKIFGLSQDAVAGIENLLQAVHPEDRAIIAEKAQEIREQPGELSIDFRVILPNEEVRWIRATGQTYFDGDRPVRMTGLCMDITERKQAERALAHSHDLMQYIIEHNRSAVAVHDRDMKYIFVSQRYLDEYQVKEKDVIGRHHYDVFPDLPQKWRIVHQKALAGEVSSAEDDPYYREDGTVDWTRWECRPWYEADGSIGGLIVYTEVITERKRAEIQIVQLSRLYATLSQVNQIIVRVKTRQELFEGICQVAVSFGEFSMAWVGLYDAHSDQVSIAATSHVLPLSDVYTHFVPSKQGLIGLALQTGRVAYSRDIQTDPRMQHWHQTAALWNFHAAAVVPFQVNGQVVGLVYLFSSDLDFFTSQQEQKLLEEIGLDISFALDMMEQEAKRKRAEEEIRILNTELEKRVCERTAQLEAANQELEAFSYSVSHDLRAPLRGIDGWSLALLEDYHDQLDEQGRLYIERVRAETQRMSHLIDDLLRLSRLTRAEMQKSMIDLSELGQSIAARLIETQPDRSVQWIIQPNLMAYGDAHLMEIVLTNLFSNAYKFTSKQALAQIEFGRTEIAGKSAFFIRDNGVGFNMAYAKNLFGAFQRMHKQSDFPGTGIGLATAQRIIRRHGGCIWADAHKDAGATFYFTLEEAP